MFAFVLVTETMTQVEWGGTVRIHSSVGKPRQKARILPNGDYSNGSVFANLPIPKIHFRVIFESWLSVLICHKNNTGDSSLICRYLIGPALSNSKVTKHVLSRFNSQTVFKWLRAGFWTWKVINLTSLISSILRLAPISLRMCGISWLLNRRVWAVSEIWNLKIFALSELSCVLVTNENMGLCLYMITLFSQKAFYSNPRPHFQNCQQNDVMMVHRSWTSFRKKNQLYTTQSLC